ncbi:hypothetical protein HK101_008323, partial [Irineochytrium annulatum]
CSGVANNNIACTSSTTFNYCLDGVFVSAQSQSCPAGTVCCANANKCDYPQNCGQVLSSPCSGKADGQQLCISSSTFNLCKSGNWASGTAQSCPPGTVCCADTNSCNVAAACKSVLPAPLAPIGLVSLSASTVSASTNVCGGIVDGNIACLNPSSFTICQYQSPVGGSQSCAPGTKCCGNACVLPTDAKCGSVCSSIPDNSIACTSQNAYTTCLNGSPITAPTYCPAGTVCCGNGCVAPTDAKCSGVIGVIPKPSYTPSSNPNPAYTPPVKVSPVVVPAGQCAGVPDYSSTCVGPFSYKYCLHGTIIKGSVAQQCAPGTVCCPATESCVANTTCATYLGQTLPVQPQVIAAPIVNKCKGVSDGHTACTDSTHWQVCMNGAPISSGACADGIQCCASTGQCALAWQCPGYTPKYKPPTVLNSCASVADGFSACSTDNLSVVTCHGGSVQATVDCTFGKTCCSATNTCTDPKACIDPCNGRGSSALICRDSTTFAFCQDNLSLGSFKCQDGYVCCARTQSCDLPQNC